MQNKTPQRGEEQSTSLITSKRTGELATSGQASAAKARIEAAYTVAMHRPRDLDMVRVRLLEACKRPGFAEAALYQKPVGGSRIKGMSVRFAEEAARLMGNIQLESHTIYDDASQRIIEVSATDLETNYRAATEVVIDKSVERRNGKGRVIIDERTNTSGDTVFVVLATEDELLVKQNNQVSKAKRNLLLDMLPGDIMHEARELIERTLRGQIEEDPAAAKKAIIDSFASLGVKPDGLKAYLGHAVDACSPRQVQELRDLYVAIKQGETSWAEVLESKEWIESGSTDEPEAKPAKRRPAPAAKPADDDALPGDEPPKKEDKTAVMSEIEYNNVINRAVEALGEDAKPLMSPILEPYGIAKFKEVNPEDRQQIADTVSELVLEYQKSDDE